MTTALILVVLAPLIPIIVDFLTTFIKTFVSGLEFTFSLFTYVPNFLMNTFIPNMPSFFQTAFFGILGFMLFILGLKIVCLIVK